MSNYTKISMSLTRYLSWRKREQRKKKKNWKRDSKRIKTKEGTYPGSKLARAPFIPWAISIQLLELTKPPLFTSCLINTLLLSAKVLLTSRSSYTSLSLLSKGSSKQGHPFFFVPFPLLHCDGQREEVRFFCPRRVVRRSFSLFCLWDESDALLSLPSFSILLHHHCFLYLYCIVTRWQCNRRSMFDYYLRSSSFSIRRRQWDIQRIARSGGVIVANENNESIITNRFESIFK